MKWPPAASNDDGAALIIHNGDKIVPDRLCTEMIDFDDEIKKHIDWRNIIELLSKGTDTSMVSVDFLEKDDNCQLGKWIYSDDAQAYAPMPEFPRLVETHKKFHHLAGQIFSLHRDGKDDEVSALKEDFYKHSNDIIVCLEIFKHSGN